MQVELRNWSKNILFDDWSAFYDVFLLNEYDKLLKRLNPGDCVLDVGANIGMFTIRASRIVGSDGVIIAIEADADNVIQLRKNIDLNRLSNVVVVQSAVYSSSQQTMKFSGGGIGGRLSQWGKQIVETTSLSDIMNDQKIDVIGGIKMDIEGGELAAFSEPYIDAVLQRTRNVAVEVHSNSALEFISSILRRNGYHVESIYTKQHSIYQMAIASIRHIHLILKALKLKSIILAGNVLSYRLHYGGLKISGDGHFQRGILSAFIPGNECTILARPEEDLARANNNK